MMADKSAVRSINRLLRLIYPPFAIGSVTMTESHTRAPVWLITCKQFIHPGKRITLTFRGFQE
jgi:hypothetical protein